MPTVRALEWLVLLLVTSPSPLHAGLLPPDFRHPPLSARRAVHTLSRLAEGCEPPLARCTHALALSPSRDPNPSYLGDDVIRCDKEECACAGAPAKFDEATKHCVIPAIGGVDAVWDDSSAAEGTDGTVERFTHATCDQVERCGSGLCTIRAWKKYTVGVPQCDAMWYCLKTKMRKWVAACETSLITTRDKDNTTCSNVALCKQHSAVLSELPDGKVDCAWEYSRVLGDTAIAKKIDERCAATACSCIRRGKVGNCSGSRTTCCVGGTPWDNYTEVDGTVQYDGLTCSEATTCLAADAYCRLVAEPEEAMPQECKGYAMTRFKGAHCPTGKVQDIASSDGVCSRSVGLCDMIRIASVATCGATPRMYQMCQNGTEVNSVGRCQCRAPAGYYAVCNTDGECDLERSVGVPVEEVIVCDNVSNCSGHAAAVRLTGQLACLCECQGNWGGDRCERCPAEWTGERCDMPAKGDEDDGGILPDSAVLGLSIGGGVLVLLLCVAVVVLAGRRGRVDIKSTLMATMPSEDLEEHLIADRPLDEPRPVQSVMPTPLPTPLPTPTLEHAKIPLTTSTATSSNVLREGLPSASAAPSEQGTHDASITIPATTRTSVSSPHASSKTQGTPPLHPRHDCKEPWFSHTGSLAGSSQVDHKERGHDKTRRKKRRKSVTPPRRPITFDETLRSLEREIQRGKREASTGTAVPDDASNFPHTRCLSPDTEMAPKFSQRRHHTPPKYRADDLAIRTRTPPKAQRPRESRTMSYQPLGALDLEALERHI